jgi:hypothetical protein
LVVHDEEVARYFAGVFESDWRAQEGGASESAGDAASPTDYALEALIIVVVSGIAVWLVAREV